MTLGIFKIMKNQVEAGPHVVQLFAFLQAVGLDGSKASLTHGFQAQISRWLHDTLMLVEPEKGSLPPVRRHRAEFILINPEVYSSASALRRSATRQRKHSERSRVTERARRKMKAHHCRHNFIFSLPLLQKHLPSQSPVGTPYPLVALILDA